MQDSYLGALVPPACPNEVFNWIYWNGSVWTGDEDLHLNCVGMFQNHGFTHTTLHVLYAK